MSQSGEVLELAERIELLAAEQYAYLVDVFADHPEARMLFSRLYEEEMQHVERVRMLRRSSFMNRSGTTSSDLAEAAMNRALDLGHRVAKRLQVLSSELSFEDAKVLMRGMEDELALAHAESVSLHSSAELREFFGKLAQQDRAHRALLEDYA